MTEEVEEGTPVLILRTKPTRPVHRPDPVPVLSFKCRSLDLNFPCHLPWGGYLRVASCQTWRGRTSTEVHGGSLVVAPGGSSELQLSPLCSSSLVEMEQSSTSAPCPASESSSAPVFL
ncbi:hypothetical protein DPEC_G00158210 [Dallia pectoralis]|uniref:Uncharacterized protein n=1 Tax=Dallia pectoralis TaxID=75939 RepID=A0ACC2GLN1_DALPE|nr:hypothetical protein DPEC_G00158210 [Dallia pectoralis]